MGLPHELPGLCQIQVKVLRMAHAAILDGPGHQESLRGQSQPSSNRGVLEGTNLRRQTEQIHADFRADSRRFSLILADFPGKQRIRRKPQIFAGNRRKPQIGVGNRRLAFVPLSAALLKLLLCSCAIRAHTVVSKLITDRDFFWGESISNYRCRIALQEELISIAETDLWEFQQKISHYRYRFFLEFQLISITDTDFGLKTN